MSETLEDLAALKEREDLMDRLTRLTAEWNEHEDVPKSQQVKCREIGKRLHALGGMDAMQEAYRAAKNCNRAAAVIQAYWDGIGDWQW